MEELEDNYKATQANKRQYKTTTSKNTFNPDKNETQISPFNIYKKDEVLDKFSKQDMVNY